MAKAFYNSMAGGTRAESAGTEPSSRVSGKAVKVMGEAGIDISRERPKLLDRRMVEGAEKMVTMGCLDRKSCPAILLNREKVEDWGLSDPRGRGMEEFRRIRDEIEVRVRRLFNQMEG